MSNREPDVLNVINDLRSRVARLELVGASRWAVPTAYGFRSYKTTTTSINSGTITGIPWDADIEDTFGFRSGASSANQFKVPAGGGGLYLAQMYILWDTVTSVTASQIACYVRNSGGTIDTTRSQRGTNLNITAASTSIVQHETWLVDMPELYEFNPWVAHNSGTARNVVATLDTNGTRFPSFEAWRIAV